MAAIATQVVKPFSLGDRWCSVCTVALDNSYPTGGYALTAAQLGLGNAANSDPELMIEADSDYGYGYRYDYVAQKLIVYSAAGTEVTNATDLSAVTLLRVKAISKYAG